MSARRRASSRMLSPASTRMRVFPVAMNAAFPELPLASTQNLTIAASLTLQNTPRFGRMRAHWNKTGLTSHVLSPFPVILPHGAVDGLRAALHRLRRLVVSEPFVPAHFFEQFAVALPPDRVELTVVERRLDRAAGRVGMRAVAKAAALCERSNIVEGAVKALLAGPELQLPHPGSVDECSSRGQWQEASRGGGMPAAAVMLPDDRRALPFFAQQRIDD